MNASLFSESKSTGRPYLKIVSSSSFLTTMEAISFLAGKVSVHQERVSIKATKFLQPYRLDFTSVRIISQLALSRVPLPVTSSCDSTFCNDEMTCGTSACIFCCFGLKVIDLMICSSQEVLYFPFTQKNTLIYLSD